MKARYLLPTISLLTILGCKTPSNFQTTNPRSTVMFREYNMGKEVYELINNAASDLMKETVRTNSYGETTTNSKERETLMKYFCDKLNTNGDNTIDIREAQKIKKIYQMLKNRGTQI